MRQPKTPCHSIMMMKLYLKALFSSNGLHLNGWLSLCLDEKWYPANSAGEWNYSLSLPPSLSLYLLPSLSLSLPLSLSLSLSLHLFLCLFPNYCCNGLSGWCHFRGGFSYSSFSMLSFFDTFKCQLWVMAEGDCRCDGANRAAYWHSRPGETTEQRQARSSNRAETSPVVKQSLCHQQPTVWNPISHAYKTHTYTHTSTAPSAHTHIQSTIHTHTLPQHHPHTQAVGSSRGGSGFCQTSWTVQSACGQYVSLHTQLLTCQGTHN